jgi:hypothetical protein
LPMAGLGIQSDRTAPGYAAAFIDDENKTFIVLPCMDEWQHRGGPQALVRLGTVSEGWRMKYEPDSNCRETAAFSESDRALTGLLLQWMSVLPPMQHWWDRPYRTEGGVVYPPGYRP